MKYKSYTISVEMEVHVKDGGLVMQNAESCASATRHMLRTLVPQGWRKNGIMVVTTTIHAEGKEKEVAPSFEMLNGNEQRDKP